MKQLMWAVYTTEQSKMPRILCDRERDAKNYCRVWHESTVMKKYGLIQRVIVEWNEKGYFDIYHHEYRKI